MVYNGDMKNCRHCGIEFTPTPRQISKYDYQCLTCKREHGRKYSSSYYKNNKEKILSKKYSTPDLIVLRAARRRLNKLMSSSCGVGKHGSVFGCSVGQLVQHIESKFTDGMSWDNYGQWHVDHVVPCRAFIGKDNWVAEAFNYNNLQPLWAKDNLSKSDKLANGISARISLTS
jgi:hypothetical protein